MNIMNCLKHFRALKKMKKERRWIWKTCQYLEYFCVYRWLTRVKDFRFLFNDHSFINFRWLGVCRQLCDM